MRLLLVVTGIVWTLGHGSAYAQDDALPSLLTIDPGTAVLTNIKSINSPAMEGAPLLINDEKTLIFTSQRSGKDVLYAADIEGDNFGNVRTFAELGGKEQINSVVFSDEGITIVSASDRKDGYFKTADIYTASFSDGKLDGFTNLGKEFNSEYWDSQPTISPDGSTLLFASDRKGGKGGIDIYLSSHTSEGRWTEPVLANFSTDQDDLAPTFSPDGKYVYFTTEDLPGAVGGYDIFAVRRNGTNEWGAPRALGTAINTRADELFLTHSADGSRVYFVSTKEGGQGSADIYRLTLKPYVEPPKMATLRLRVIDAVTGIPITVMPEVNLTLNNGEKPANEAQGNAYATTMLAGTGFSAVVGAEGYVSRQLQGTAPLVAGDFTEEVRLDPARARVIGNVTNVFTHKPVEATLSVENMTTGTTSTVRADRTTGAYSFTANPTHKYRISTSVQDYDAFSTIVEVPTAREQMITVEKAIRLQPATIDAVMLYFETARSNLKKEEIAKMGRFIEQVKENPYVRIEVNGHTDDVGSEEYNEKLSERRAVTVEDYLLSKGVPRDQLAIVKGFGKAAPLVEGTSEEARAKNRRVEVRIVGMDK